MNEREVASPPRTWPHAGVHRIPYAAYTHEETYARELARLFYHGHWCYVRLEA